MEVASLEPASQQLASAKLDGLLRPEPDGVEDRPEDFLAPNQIELEAVFVKLTEQLLRHRISRHLSGLV